jgi:nucleotide-binding universal stress UspA family protein
MTDASASAPAGEPQPAGPPAATERVVVGVDDAPASAAALRWAAAEAVLRRARLEIVHTWQAVIPLEPAGMVTPPVNADIEAGARAATEELVATTRAAVDAWPDDVAVQVLEGPAGPLLVETAQGASLLVVGNKGHSTIAEVVLGSVSRHATHHAPCPVVVVRPTKETV